MSGLTLNYFFILLLNKHHLKAPFICKPFCPVWFHKLHHGWKKMNGVFMAKETWHIQGLSEIPQNYFGNDSAAELFHTGSDSCQVLSGKMIWSGPSISPGGKLMEKGLGCLFCPPTIHSFEWHTQVVNIGLCCRLFSLLWDRLQIRQTPSKRNQYSVQMKVPQHVCTFL